MAQLISPEGYKAILERIEEYKSEMYEIAKEIAEASSKKDLSENAEYHAAKEKQRLLMQKLSKLDHIASSSTVVEYKGSLSDVVEFGATVELLNLDNGNRFTYKIVSVFESDVGNGLISIESPVARELINKKVGDVVVIKVGGNSGVSERVLELISIEYI